MKFTYDYAILDRIFTIQDLLPKMNYAIKHEGYVQINEVCFSSFACEHFTFKYDSLFNELLVTVNAYGVDITIIRFMDVKRILYNLQSDTQICAYTRILDNEFDNDYEFN